MKTIMKCNLSITIRFEKCDYITNIMIKQNIMGGVIASNHSIYCTFQKENNKRGIEKYLKSHDCILSDNIR